MESFSKEISPEIIFALETAKGKFDADAVYFRYFSDERAAVPQLYLFDYSKKSITKEDKKRFIPQSGKIFFTLLTIIVTQHFFMALSY
jgi:hypothetical protein